MVRGRRGGSNMLAYWRCSIVEAGIEGRFVPCYLRLRLFLHALDIINSINIPNTISKVLAGAKYDVMVLTLSS